MAAETLQTHAFVLTRRAAADPYQAYQLFSAEHGALHALQRLSRKNPAGQATLDLFDEAALVLESSSQGRTWFVREARVLARAPAGGWSYAALQAASAFTLMIARNPVIAESRGRIAALLRTGIAAFAAGERPAIVAFKCLYCFARDEGHPVKEQWFPLLPAADREAVAALINRPLAGQAASAETVARLQLSLEEYLRGYTEILLE